MTGRARLGALLLLVPAFLRDPGVAAGHPHVFIEQSAVIVLGSTGLEAVRLTWTFDEMASTQLLFEFDTDRDGALGPNEVDALRQKWLEPLKPDNYYIDLKVSGAAVAVGPARDLHASVAKGLVSLTFTVSARGARAGSGAIDIAVDDPTSMMAFAFRPRDPVAVEAPKGHRVACTVTPSRDPAELEVARCMHR